MRYLAGLFIAVFILLNIIPAYAEDGKDGAAVVTLYNDPQQTKYYVNDIYSTGRSRGVHCGIDTNMDNVKISSVFGDITLAGNYSFILNNETTNRLVFLILSDNKNEGILSISGAFILKNKKTNKILNKDTDKSCIVFENNNKIRYNTHTYNRNNVIITTMDGIPVSIDGKIFNYKITLRKGNYEFISHIGESPLRCHFGLAGQK